MADGEETTSRAGESVQERACSTVKVLPQAQSMGIRDGVHSSLSASASVKMLLCRQFGDLPELHDMAVLLLHICTQYWLPCLQIS